MLNEVRLVVLLVQPAVVGAVLLERIALGESLRRGWRKEKSGGDNGGK